MLQHPVVNYNHGDRGHHPLGLEHAPASIGSKSVTFGGNSSLYLWLATIMVIVVIIHLVLEYAPAVQHPMVVSFNCGCGRNCNVRWYSELLYNRTPVALHAFNFGD